MELLGDVGHVESCLDPFGDTVSVGARLVHDLRQTYHMLRNHFGRIQWNSKVTWVMWNHVTIRFEIVLVSLQDRYTICAKYIVGLEIVLDAPGVTLR
jgi:hypothetical protein